MIELTSEEIELVSGAQLSGAEKIEIFGAGVAIGLAIVALAVAVALA